MPSPLPPPSIFQLVLWWGVYISPLLSVVIIGITAVILWKYTRETQRLRETAERQTDNIEKQISVSQQQVQATQRQIEVMQRPFVVIDPLWENHNLKTINVRNIGNSTALNVEVIAGPRRIKIPILEGGEAIEVEVFQDDTQSIALRDLIEIYASTPRSPVEKPPVFPLDATSRHNGVGFKIEYHNVAMIQYYTTEFVRPTGVTIEASASMTSGPIPSLPVMHT